MKVELDLLLVIDIIICMVANMILLIIEIMREEK